MLESIFLRGFRACGDHTSLGLSKLNVLSGPNNTGKSSVIGALLAFAQSEQANAGELLLLDGSWVELGTYPEVLAPGSTSFSFGVAGRRDGRALDVEWSFSEPAERDRPMARVQRVTALVDEEELTLELNGGQVQLSRQAGGLEPAALPHPGAFRSTGGALTPLLPFDAARVLAVGPWRQPPERLSRYRQGTAGPAVGRYGEHTAQLYFEKRALETDVLAPGATTALRLEEALDGWWRYILGAEVAVRVEEVRRTGFQARIDTEGADQLSFAQVGFGLSQLWPILVAGLVSAPGDLVIIETPEAHLHPAAQHRVARLFVELARRGRQVIVESHSEHVLASVSLALKEALLLPEDVAVHYFTQEKGQTQVQRIPMDASGRRLKAPPGFFDQAAIDLLALLK